MLKRGFQFAPGYRLQEFLGRGQFGQVWRASAPGGAGMAAKFIDLSDGQGQKEYEGVKRVKQVRHANLMPITAIWLLDGQGNVIEEVPDDVNETIDLSAVESQGRSAIAMAPIIEASWLVVGMLLGGKSLQQRLRECVTDGMPGIPPKELISYLDESAKGLDFLNAPQHDLGEGPIAIQHSDVKPANIVLIGSSAVVCDFGLARILTRNQVTATSAAGTPAYMAPEAISGKPSCHSDQYSLAVTYYHLRTGTLPVSDGSLWEVLDAHRHGKLNLSAVSEAEQAVLRKATHLQWEQRFESNVEMVDAMRDALRAEGHTKPSFLTADLKRSPGTHDQAGTHAIQEKGETNTGSMSSRSLSIGVPQSGKETNALRNPGESTQKQQFANETLPALADRNQAEEPLDVGDSGDRSESPAEARDERSNLVRAQRWARTNPALAATGIGALVLLACFAGWRWTHPQDLGEPVVAEQEDGDWLSKSYAMWEQDEAEAVKLFQQALSAEQPPSLSPQSLVGLRGAVMDMATNADGTVLIAMADGPTAFAWRLKSLDADGFPLRGHERLMNAVAVHPSENLAVTAGADRTARVWNLGASDLGESAISLEGHRQPIESAAWHPLQRVAVTASADLTMRLWKIDESGALAVVNSNQSSFPIQELITGLASDANGRWLAGITLGADLVDPKPDVLLYPWNALLEMQGVPEPTRLGTENAKHVAFLNRSPDDVIVCGERGGSLAFYSTASGDLIGRMPSHQLDVEALCVASLGDDPIIVSAGADGTVQHLRYDESARTSLRLFCPESGVSCIDVSEDGRWVAAGCGEGTVWLWDTTVEGNGSEGALQIDADCGSVDSVLINEPLQQLIVGGDDGTIRLYDLKMAKLMTLAAPTPTIDGEAREITLPKFSMRID